MLLRELEKRPKGQPAFLLLLHDFRALDNHITPPVLTLSTAKSLPCSPIPSTPPVCNTPP